MGYVRKAKDTWESIVNVVKVTVRQVHMKSKKYILPAIPMRTIAAFAAGAVIMGGLLFYYDYSKTGYAVHYNGKLVGYVRQKSEAINMFESAKSDIKQYDPGITVSDALTFEKVKLSNEKLTDESLIKQNIQKDLYVRFTGYAISVNGKEVAVVGSSDEANQVIEGVKKYFADQESKDEVEVVNVNIKDDIKTSSRISSSISMVDVNTAINKLVANKNTIEKYQVKEGDTLWKISSDNHLKLSEIVDANPKLNLDKLVPGQTINLSKVVPPLNVEVTLKITNDEKVAFATQYTSDSSIYKNQTKVVKDGEYGISRVISQITKLNGVEVARSILTTAVVKSPVAKIVAKGTKALVGSGSFIWPVNGHLTSGFGSRGGEFHAGVDICAPQGTPIHAADSGTVVHAGWYYGYGNLVIINHKNGYSTYYGHCSAIYVNAGQEVGKNQVIAAVGHTGDADGNHVHFEVRLNGTARNPLQYLK